jgi:hypothetical protein
MEKGQISNQFFTYETNKKKLDALINFSETVDNFSDWLAIEYLAHWMQKESLGEEGIRFLDYILQKWGVNYLDWCYKTPWVKKQIASRRGHQRAFVFEDLEKERINAWRLLPKSSFAKKYMMIQLDDENKKVAS